MFKIGEVPSLAAGPIDHADFLELECLRKSARKVSAGDLGAALGRMDDDLLQDRVVSDARMENLIDEAIDELVKREQHGGNSPCRYPFHVSDDGKLVEFTGYKGSCEFYLFLLLATRMNMRDDRVQDRIDGTELFEEICCEVAKSYWGQRTDGFVFGTARRNGENEVAAFPDAINLLCGRMGEGVQFFSHSGTPPSAQDGNLDLVVWKSFSDRRVGKLIGFGQCKTGTHWKKGIFELAPEGFCRKWVRTQPAVKPIRLYFITARPRHAEWYDLCVDGGILFDRCRILDFAPKMPRLKARWKKWVKVAMRKHGLCAI